MVRLISLLFTLLATVQLPVIFLVLHQNLVLLWLSSQAKVSGTMRRINSGKTKFFCTFFWLSPSFFLSVVSFYNPSFLKRLLGYIFPAPPMIYGRTTRLAHSILCSRGISVYVLIEKNFKKWCVVCYLKALLMKHNRSSIVLNGHFSSTTSSSHNDEVCLFERFELIHHKLQNSLFFEAIKAQSIWL